MMSLVLTCFWGDTIPSGKPKTAASKVGASGPILVSRAARWGRKLPPDCRPPMASKRAPASASCDDIVSASTTVRELNILVGD